MRHHQLHWLLPLVLLAPELLPGAGAWTTSLAPTTDQRHLPADWAYSWQRHPWPDTPAIPHSIPAGQRQFTAGENGLPASWFTCATSWNGRIVLGSSIGLILLEEQQYHYWHAGGFPSHLPNPEQANSPLPRNNIEMLHVDPIGNLWVGTWWGVCRISEESFDVLSYRGFDNDATIPLLALLNPVCFLNTRAGDLLIGTRGNRIDRYDPRTDRFTTICYQRDKGWIVGLAEDSSGRIWAATKTAVGFLTGGDQWRWFDQGEPWIPNESLNSLAIDDDDTIWVGSWNGLGRLEANGQASLLDDTDLFPTATIMQLVDLDTHGLLLTTAAHTAIHRQGRWLYPTYAQMQPAPLRAYWQKAFFDQEGVLWRVDGTRIYRARQTSPLLDVLDERSPELIQRQRFEDSYPALPPGRQEAASIPFNGQPTTWTRLGDAIYSYDGHSWRDQTRLLGVGDHDLQFAHADSTQRFWFGVYARGLFRVDKHGIQRHWHNDWHTESAVTDYHYDNEGRFYVSGSHHIFQLQDDLSWQELDLSGQRWLNHVAISDRNTFWTAEFDTGQLLAHDHGQIHDFSSDPAMDGAQVWRLETSDSELDTALVTLRRLEPITGVPRAEYYLCTTRELKKVTAQELETHRRPTER